MKKGLICFKSFLNGIINLGDNMWWNVFLLILGLALIIVSSNIFVDSASNLASSFKVPKMVIALTIAAFCTCAPELAISFNSIANNNYDLTISNVVGSCAVNILLIIGLASVVKPVKIKTVTVSKELPFLVIVTSMFCLLFLDNVLSRYDAVVLLLLFILFCFYLYRMVKRFKKIEYDEIKQGKIKSLIFTFISLAAIVFSSDLIVDSTLYLSEQLNVSTKLISMTVVVIGTSLPELMITITSAKKGEFDMTVGNIIGTNIFNICIVLGLPVLIFGSINSMAFNYIDLIAILIAALMFYLLGRSQRTISRLEGILMLLLFVLYYSYLIIF